MRRPGYREAVRWIALNDDTEWVHEAAPIISVTAAFVIDLWGVSEERFIGDLKREVERLNKA